MILDKFKLDNKVAIVTGCSHLNGLGYGIAEGLAEAGANIAGVARSEMTEVKKGINKIGKEFLSINYDLKNIKNINYIINETKKEFGQIDILVNNAGIIKRNIARDFNEKDWDDVINVNLKSMFFLSKAVAKEFITHKKKGKIINIASILSYQGGILVPSYTASKHGVAGITKALANEWAKHNINVNAIAPGYMVTENTAALRKNKDRNQAIIKRIPAGEWGKNNDLKGISVYLASDASNYVHGSVIPVDGGWLAR